LKRRAVVVTENARAVPVVDGKNEGGVEADRFSLESGGAALADPVLFSYSFMRRAAKTNERH